MIENSPESKYGLDWNVLFSMGAQQGSEGDKLTQQALEEDVLTQQALEGDVLANLYPALAQCIFVIFVGYLTGRLRVIPEGGVKGIGSFVGNVALPSLLFKSMLTLSFNSLNWGFLLTIFTSKGLLFAVTSGLTAILFYDRQNGIPWATMGIFSIFVTQSNDFALGLPILQAIYSETHPGFLEYIYLLAPISLCILNPVGFLMLELSKVRDAPVHSTSSSPLISWLQNMLHIFLNVIKNVLLNPVVPATAIGLVANLILKDKVPSIFSEIVKMLGDCFNGTALFLLGLNMVGKIRDSFNLKALTFPALLAFAKVVILPVIIFQFSHVTNTTSMSYIVPASNKTLDKLNLTSTNYAYVQQFAVPEPNPDSDSLYANTKVWNQTWDIDPLRLFGFLYGTFPTAPSVFVFASHYNAQVSIVATGLMLCTFFAAPVMFVTAKTLLLPVTCSTITDVEKNLAETYTDLSIFSILCIAWVAITFIIFKRWKSFLNKIVIHIAMSTAIMNTALLIFFYSKQESSAQVLLYLFGLYANFLWTAGLSVSLAFYQSHFLAKTFPTFYKSLKYLPYIVYSVAGLSSIILFSLTNEKSRTTPGPFFARALAQSITTTIVIMISFFFCISGLIALYRYADKDADEETNSESESDTSSNSYSPSTKRHYANEGYTPEISTIYQSINHSGITKTVDTQVLLDQSDSLIDVIVNDNVSISNNLDDDKVSTPWSVITLNRGTSNESSLSTTSCSSSSDYYSSSSSSPSSSSPSTPSCTTHKILVVILTLSLLVELIQIIWRLEKEIREELQGVMTSTPSTPYIEITFLSSILSSARGFFIWILFGLDRQNLVTPILTWLRRRIFMIRTYTLNSANV